MWFCAGICLSEPELLIKLNMLSRCYAEGLWLWVEIQRCIMYHGGHGECCKHQGCMALLGFREEPGLIYSGYKSMVFPQQCAVKTDGHHSDIEDAHCAEQIFHFR